MMKVVGHLYIKAYVSIIGYGNIAPGTFAGRLFCILFAIVSHLYDNYIFLGLEARNLAIMIITVNLPIF